MKLGPWRELLKIEGSRYVFTIRVRGIRRNPPVDMTPPCPPCQRRDDRPSPSGLPWGCPFTGRACEPAED